MITGKTEQLNSILSSSNSSYKNDEVHSMGSETKKINKNQRKHQVKVKES